jgi:hypothetical protein
MHPDPETLRAQLDYLETTRKHFDTVLHEDEYNKMIEKKERRLSYKVCVCALARSHTRRASSCD